jgi:hypothetical protein
MSPSGPSDQDTVDRLADEFVARHRRGERPDLAEYARRDPSQVFLVAALYRAGSYGDAILRADQAKVERVEPLWTAWPFLAMAHARLGHHQKARELLDKSRAGARSIPLDGPSWDDWLMMNILNREAEALLSTRHPEGAKEQPARAAPPSR